MNNGLVGCEFNPNNLPNEKIGICSHEDHESWTGDEPKEQKLRLMMYYSDEYNKRYDALDINKMSTEAFDKEMEELEKIQYNPNSAQYWCEGCFECLE